MFLSVSILKESVHWPLLDQIGGSTKTDRSERTNFSCKKLLQGRGKGGGDPCAAGAPDPNLSGSLNAMTQDIIFDLSQCHLFRCTVLFVLYYYKISVFWSGVMFWRGCTKGAWARTTVGFEIYKVFCNLKPFVLSKYFLMLVVQQSS